ncbi:putative fibroblast growth factor 1 isoform X2 [Nothobranchius furzeri]|uniref:putative fibroblast growth factor 1 isoform X2 n=1 Tax=Nothobranchius furzeri TaxID=105023 RepID=UPI003904D90B
MADGDALIAGDQAEDGGLSLLLDYRRRTQLYCMNGGYHLQILPDGTVQGQREDRDVHSKAAAETYCACSHPGQAYCRCAHVAVLKLRAVDRGVVVIQGTETERYLAMSEEGRLYGSRAVTDECYFLEKLEENHYNTYQSQKYQDNQWYVALKKNGKPKLGPRTHIGQKAIFFLPRRIDFSQD